MVELELLLQEALPKEVRVYICDLYCRELNETVTMKETSSILQQRCTLLYLLGNLSAQPVCQHLLTSVTLPMLDETVSFENRFPIQEKYYACLYACLLRQFPDIRSMDVSIKTRVFNYAFSGLSCRLEIVQKMSWLILDQLKSRSSISSIESLLKADNGHFFHNLFAKLRYFSAGMSSFHVHMNLVSLKNHAPSLFDEVVVELL